MTAIWEMDVSGAVGTPVVVCETQSSRRAVAVRDVVETFSHGTGSGRDVIMEQEALGWGSAARPISKT